jgi:hypothetical protein
VADLGFGRLFAFFADVEPVDLIQIKDVMQRLEKRRLAAETLSHERVKRDRRVRALVASHNGFLDAAEGLINY